MNRRAFLATTVALSTGLLSSCQEGQRTPASKGNPMTTSTEQLLHALFSATSADQERERAIALADHLQQSGDAWSLALREPNSTALLTPQEYVQSTSAVALITARDAAYVWIPTDKRNIDMLMLE